MEFLHSVWENIKPFVFGGVAGCTATFAIHPIDTVKVRIQVKGELAGLAAAEGQTVQKGVWNVVKEVYKLDGFTGFYRGFYFRLQSALLRQVVYGTVRLGLYRYCADWHKSSKGAELSFLEKGFWSSFSGVAAVLVGNPPDICLVRFQTDSMLPAAERRNYKNAFDALVRIGREEGAKTLWRGSVTNMVRAIAMNVGMLATYDEAKERIMHYNGRSKETMTDRLLASCIAGFSCSFLSLPFDNCKTKLQKMKPNAKGILPYKNLFDVLKQTIRREGVTGLWIGFPVFYSRVAPHAMISLLVQDFLYQLSNKNH